MKRNPFLILLTLFVFTPIVTISVLTAAGTFEMRTLRILGEAPKFDLIERTGTNYGSQDLAGKVWIASFIFTKCAGQCPLLCQKLERIQSRFRFKEHFRMVSFSVDPEHDTPGVLREYADRFHADPYKWLFLTGDKKQIRQITREGFKLAVEDAPQEIIHSFKLALVDRWGRVRGYYDGLEEDSIKQLMRDTKQLLKEAF